ncbi:MAG TPA: autotransporter outer membrane beta-barrel domain-containing protein [Parachlamydiaceae bacterium]|nr:autotransporter outer membrane beta-barrel domain-containing protein [Parachlamydiaceae bacterium]
MLKSICLNATALLLCTQICATLPPYIATTSNQQLVIDQLENIDNEKEGRQGLLLGLLAPLGETETQKALKQLAGTPYTTLFISSEIINRQFLRRLYDPLRVIITNPCSYDDEVYDICSSKGIDAWAEGSVNRSFLNGNKNGNGFKMSGYEVSVGAHKRMTSTWTLGAGGSYAIDHFHYNVGGSSKTNAVLGGVYALYRPANYYTLANVTFGYFTNDMHRRVQLYNEPVKSTPPAGESNSPGVLAYHAAQLSAALYRSANNYIVKSRPNISEVTFYGEAGFDWNCNCVLVQPFIGFEANRFIRRCKYDHSKLSPLKLIYSSKDVTNAYSRLGVHLTTPENCYDLIFSFDLAWQYRLTSSQNNLTVRFEDFGTPFNLTGVPNERNSLSMGFTVWSEIFDGWTLYLEASGERWKRVSNYQFTGGLLFKW